VRLQLGKEKRRVAAWQKVISVAPSAGLEVNLAREIADVAQILQMAVVM
jgi:hypothetical protein